MVGRSVHCRDQVSPTVATCDGGFGAVLDLVLGGFEERHQALEKRVAHVVTHEVLDQLTRLILYLQVQRPEQHQNWLHYGWAGCTDNRLNDQRIQWKLLSVKRPGFQTSHRAR